MKMTHLNASIFFPFDNSLGQIVLRSSINILFCETAGSFIIGLPVHVAQIENVNFKVFN